MARTHWFEKGDCEPANPSGGTWIQAVSHGIGSQSADAGIECSRRPGEGGGRTRSRGSISGVAAGASATGAGRPDAGAGDADHRSDGSGAATESERSGAGGGSGDSGIESAAGTSSE